MITDVDGVRLGHWTDPAAKTGCTVVLFPAGTVASGEVRGGAPGTREFALLEPGRLVEHVNAVVLAGGSAFGLAACDGVMGWCEERGIGFPTAHGPVPIVVGMVIYDLGVGDPSVRPGSAEGRAACETAVAAAGSLDPATGAGAGATASKWWGPESRRAGGIASSSITDGALVVGAVVVANPIGDLRERAAERSAKGAAGVRAFENTTIGVVATNARLDKGECHLVAQSAHDGLARAIEPVHLREDGDAFVAAATGQITAPVDAVRVLAARCVEASLRAALA
ncbi:MAG: P1 family peptidase [Acidimicrobiales bacterium]